MATKEVPYSMNEKLMGECVIFDIEEFIKNPENKRTGSEYDTKMIDRTFKAFGYTMHPFKNPTKEKIEDEMKSIMSNYQEESSSFICFILSHGSGQNKILTSDNVKMDLTEIIKICDQPVLSGKPKIFVVQACRGKECDIGSKKGEEDNALIGFEEMMPIVTSPDFLIIYATPPGYVSYRRQDGTSFIHMLCYTLEKYRTDESVCVLLQRLIMTISCMPVKVENKEGWFLQVPLFVSTLTKSLHLRRITADVIDSRKINTVVHSEAEVLRRKIVRLLHKGDKMNLDIADYHNSEASLYHHFLQEEVSGCYDLSQHRVRYCLVINKASVAIATNDSKDIETAMTSLKFGVKTLNDSKANTDELKRSLKSIRNDGKQFGCVFCFIQIDADKNESQDNEITTIIGTVKNQGCFLNRPKVFIIQRYQAQAVSKTDSPEGLPSRTVRYSKESDVLIVQAWPASTGQNSFIKLFCKEYCKEYEENAGAVCIIGFLQHMLPVKNEQVWKTQQPTICSSMRKHLIMADHFDTFTYKHESEKELCEKLKGIIKIMEVDIKRGEEKAVLARQDNLNNEEDERELELVYKSRSTVFGRICRMIVNEMENWLEVCSLQ